MRGFQHLDRSLRDGHLGNGAFFFLRFSLFLPTGVEPRERDELFYRLVDLDFSAKWGVLALLMNAYHSVAAAAGHGDRVETDAHIRISTYNNKSRRDYKTRVLGPICASHRSARPLCLATQSRVGELQQG